MLHMVEGYDDMVELASASDGDACRFTDGSDRVFIYQQGRWIENVLLGLSDHRLLTDLERILAGLQALPFVRIHNIVHLTDLTVIVNCRLIIDDRLTVRYPVSSVSVLLDGTAPAIRRTVIWLFNDDTGQTRQRYEERDLFRADAVIQYIDQVTKFLNDGVDPTGIPWNTLPESWQEVDPRSYSMTYGDLTEFARLDSAISEQEVEI